MKTCTHTNCNYPVFSKGLCMNHWRSSEHNKPLKSKSKLVYSTKEIKKVSTRQQRLNAAYKTLRDTFMKSHKVCQAQLSECTVKATECHHKAGRGQYLLDDTKYMALCNNCHRWINEHNTAATEMGFCESRLNKAL